MVGIVKRGKRKGKQETLRGLTTGVIKMSGLRQLLWCMVAGDKFPSWLPHCGALGLEVVCVQVWSNEFINIIEQHVSETCVIQVGLISSSMPLIDGHATTSLLIGASLSKAKLVLSTKWMRGQAYGWVE